MRRVSEPPDPRDPSGFGPDSPEISAAAERARQQIREEFKRLRDEIHEQCAEDGSGDVPSGTGFRHRARLSLAALALSAAVAAAAANFALHGGRSSKEGDASLPQPSPAPEAGAIAAAPESPRAPGPQAPLHFLSGVAPGVLFERLGSTGSSPAKDAVLEGPTPAFVVGNPVPAGQPGGADGGVGNSSPVRQHPTPTPASPPPEAPQALAYSPPPPAPDGASVGDGGNPASGPDHGGDAAGGRGHGGGAAHGAEGEGRRGGGGSGGKTAAAVVDPEASGGAGNGLGKGHVNAQGKGHDGASPGKGHQKYDNGDVPEQGTPGGQGSPGPDFGSHGHVHGPRGAKHPAPAPPASVPAPPAPAPPSGSGGGPGKSQEDHGNGNGKIDAPGQLKK